MQNFIRRCFPNLCEHSATNFSYSYDLGENILVKLFYMKKNSESISKRYSTPKFYKQLQMPRVKNHCGQPEPQRLFIEEGR